MTSEFAYVMAAEAIGKFEVPKRAQYLRVLVAELQRIASHCLWLGTWCMDMGGALGGGATIFLYCIRERELVLDLFESLVGARLLYGFYQVGGVALRHARRLGDAVPRRRSISSSSASASTSRCSRTTRSSTMRDARASASSRASWRRTSASRGPLLRGSGVELRPPPRRSRIRRTRTSSSACRSKRPATASRATACGWWSSASRSRSSGRCSTGCPRARSRRVPALKSVAQIRIPKGEAYARVEGPRGEVGCYLIADGSAKPYRMKWRGASFSNLAILPHIIPGP